MGFFGSCRFVSLLGLFLALWTFDARISDALADISFDGKRLEAELPNGQALASSEIGSIQVKFSRAAGTVDGAPLLLIQGLRTYIEVAYSKDNASLSFKPLTSTANDDGAVRIGSGLNARPDHVLQLSLGNAQWSVLIDNKPVGTLSAGDFATMPGEQLKIDVGGPGFVGVIGLTSASREGLPYVLTTPAGQIMIRAVPHPGIYIESDTGGTEVKQVNLPGVAPDHHGVFHKQTFYAITPTADGIAVSVDWGGVLDLTPDPANPRIYRPKDAAYRWAGGLEFDDESAVDATPQFKGVNSFATSQLPFVRNGVTYVMLPPRAEGEGEQAIGSVWATSSLPPNFKYSLLSCYNVATMSLEDLQISGCGNNGLFALPPAKSGNYSTDAAPNIVPFGWQWNKLVVGEATVFSTLMTSSRDATSSFSGSGSSGFNILGYSQSRNTTTENEYRSLIAKEEMQQVQQFFQREYSLVLDPREVRLDPCFVRRVMRAAATIKAKTLLGVADPSKLTLDQMPAGPEYFEPQKAYSGCPERLNSPYQPTQFMPAYGTHYANAITYGARAVRKVQYKRGEIVNMLRDRYDLSESQGFEVKATVNAGSKNAGVSTEIKGGFNSGSGTSTSGSGTTSKTYKSDSSSGKCYGGISCSGDMVNVGREPVPIYLDLVRLDRLLAPPFFTDLWVIRDLRQAVAGEIDKALAGVGTEIPPVLRVMDVTFDSQTCTYAPNLLNSSGKLPPFLGFVGQACMKVVNSVALAAYALDDSSAKILNLEMQNPDSTAVTAVGNIPALSDMMSSLGGARPRFRMIVEPRFDASGRPVANQQIGFQLFETAASATSLVPNCKKSPCVSTYSFPIDGWLSADGAVAMGWKENIAVATNYLGFSSTKPTPSSVSGVAAYFDRSTKDYFYSNFGFTRVPARWFDLKLTLALAEADLPGVLGFKPDASPSVQTGYQGLSALEPNGVFPWKFGDPLNNSGMFQRCETVFGVGNCELRALIVYAKPARQRK